MKKVKCSRGCIHWPLKSTDPGRLERDKGHLHEEQAERDCDVEAAGSCLSGGCGEHGDIPDKDWVLAQHGSRLTERGLLEPIQHEAVSAPVIRCMK